MQKEQAAMKAQRLLDLSIRLARKLEDTVNLIATNKKHTTIGYFTLVRNRRLAEGIDLLGQTHAYEGRILLRSMIEIHINYAWIRCRKPTLRANRFFRFHPLEQLAIIDGLMESTPSPELLKEEWRDLRRQRAATRHLFQYRKKRRLRWADSCFRTTSLKSRLDEVLKLETPTKQSGFLYTLYRWTSSAVHFCTVEP